MSDVEIREALKSGDIRIDPFDPDSLGPCSVDLRLDTLFRVFGGDGEVDPRRLETVDRGARLVDTGGEPFTLQPGQFVLARTVERIAISKGLAAFLEGRSSVARMGVIVHAAGLVNPGTGMTKPVPVVLEIFNENVVPVRLYPGMRIVQIIFMRLGRPASAGYDERPSSKFVSQEEPSLLSSRG
ncbi:MAG: dCTP deaminase [Candidatus Korarchaeota archaeon]|nr:dCTP deaminase [Candidatus Korarchaeota archaeon]